MSITEYGCCWVGGYRVGDGESSLLNFLRYIWLTCSFLPSGYVVFLGDSGLGLFDPVFLAVFRYVALGRLI